MFLVDRKIQTYKIHNAVKEIVHQTSQKIGQVQIWLDRPKLISNRLKRKKIFVEKRNFLLKIQYLVIFCADQFSKNFTIVVSIEHHL